MAGMEGFGHVPRPRNFTIESRAFIGKFPCGLPQAILTPSCHSGIRIPVSNKVKTRRYKYLRDFTWLGREYVNGTFTDEDIQNVDDIEEIQKLLDDTSEDEPCSE